MGQLPRGPMHIVLAQISVALNLPENKREIFLEILSGGLPAQRECNKGNTEHMAECFSVLLDNNPSTSDVPQPEM